MQPSLQHSPPVFERNLVAISFCVALIIGLRFSAHAQEQASEKTLSGTKPQTGQPPAAMQDLANLVASNILSFKPVNPERVLVLDFKGPNDRWLPFSAWLADEFSAALGNADKRLEVVPRSKLAAAIAERHLKPADTFEERLAETLAESLEAHVIVTGSFEATENALNLAMKYIVRGEDTWVFLPWRDYIRGDIALPPEVANSFGITLDSLRPKARSYESGKGGVGYPSCIYCPSPEYSREAVDRKVIGTVVLLVTISADGRATDIKVTKGIGFGLDEKAIEAVKKWKFKPTTDSSGKPIAVRAPVMITFHVN
jgi:TonB family protein